VIGFEKVLVCGLVCDCMGEVDFQCSFRMDGVVARTSEVLRGSRESAVGRGSGRWYGLVGLLM
jgi:hypothetical protein